MLTPARLARALRRPEGEGSRPVAVPPVRLPRVQLTEEQALQRDLLDARARGDVSEVGRLTSVLNRWVA